MGGGEPAEARRATPAAIEATPRTSAADEPTTDDNSLHICLDHGEGVGGDVNGGGRGGNNGGREGGSRDHGDNAAAFLEARVADCGPQGCPNPNGRGTEVEHLVRWVEGADLLGTAGPVGRGARRRPLLLARLRDGASDNRDGSSAPSSSSSSSNTSDADAPTRAARTRITSSEPNSTPNAAVASFLQAFCGERAMDGEGRPVVSVDGTSGDNWVSSGNGSSEAGAGAGAGGANRPSVGRSIADRGEGSGGGGDGGRGGHGGRGECGERAHAEPPPPPRVGRSGAVLPRPPPSAGASWAGVLSAGEGTGAAMRSGGVAGGIAAVPAVAVRPLAAHISLAVAPPPSSRVPLPPVGTQFWDVEHRQWTASCAPRPSLSLSLRLPLALPVSVVRAPFAQPRTLRGGGLV